MASNPIAWAATPDDVATLPRNAVHDMIERLLAWIDEKDGDPDLELDGDELDGNGSEDDFMTHTGDGRPGCPIADPDKGADDDGEGVDDDTELNGDEKDSNNAEDEVLHSAFASGPGCIISDPDHGHDGD